MRTAPNALVCDFLEWLEIRERSYAEAMDVWRTSCPRLTVWEDAIEGGLVVRARNGGRPAVRTTEEGRAWLRVQRASELRSLHDK